MLSGSGFCLRWQSGGVGGFLVHSLPVKLSLHRSLGFWSGILVMGFIVFAWWASMLKFARVQCSVLRKGRAGRQAEKEEAHEGAFENQATCDPERAGDGVKSAARDDDEIQLKDEP